MNPRSKGDCRQQEEQVIRHLEVIRFQVQRGKERGDPHPTPHLATKRQHHPAENRRHGGNGPNLGGMTCRQVQDVQRRQPKSNAQQHGQPMRHTQAQSKHVGRDHGHEERPHFNGNQRSDCLPNGARRRVDVGGHPSEHAVGPLRKLTLSSLDITGFLGHANVGLDVSLAQGLSFQHNGRHQHRGGHEQHTEHKKVRQGFWNQRPEINGTHEVQVMAIRTDVHGLK